MDERTAYAVYQDGFAICGVGETPEEALADAEESCCGPITLTEQQGVRGGIYLVPCTQSLVERVIEFGGNIIWWSREDGVLCLLDGPEHIG